jgi:hypothetical protein
MYRVLINSGYNVWSLSDPMELTEILAYIANMGSPNYMVVREQRLGLTIGEAD